MPSGAPTFSEALRWCCEVYATLKAELAKAGLSTGVGDEGGFAPDLKTNKDPLRYMSQAVEDAGFELGRDFRFAMDPAVSELYNRETGLYELRGEGLTLSASELIDYWEALIAEFPTMPPDSCLVDSTWLPACDLPLSRLGNLLVLKWLLEKPLFEQPFGGAMFVGRQEELRRLEDAYGTGTFQMAVIYGRRRVGKSRTWRHILVTIASPSVEMPSTTFLNRRAGERPVFTQTPHEPRVPAGASPWPAAASLAPMRLSR